MTNKIQGLENYTYLTRLGQPISHAPRREIPPGEDRLLEHEQPSSCCNIVELFERVASCFSSLLKTLFLCFCTKSSATYCKAMAEPARADFLRSHPGFADESWQGVLKAIVTRPQDFEYATLGLSESREGTLDRQSSPRRAVHRHILGRASENQKAPLNYVYWGKSGLLQALFEVVTLANLGHTNLDITAIENDANEFALFKGIVQEFAAEKGITLTIQRVVSVSDYKGSADLISIPEGENPEEALPLQECLKPESGRLVFGHDEAIALIDRERVLSETRHKNLSFGHYASITKG